MISVVIPVRNRFEFLEACLASVCTAARRATCVDSIMVVDNSDEGNGVPPCIKEFYNDVVFLRPVGVLRMAENWNRCVGLSTGSWIHLLHDDDRIEPEFYQRVGAVIDSVEGVAGVGAIFTQASYIDEAGVRSGRMAPREEVSGIMHDFVAKCCTFNFVPNPGVIFTREAFTSLRGFSSELEYCSDWDLWLRIGLARRVLFINEYLVEYRVHQMADSSRIFKEGVNVRELWAVGNRYNPLGSGHAERRRKLAMFVAGNALGASLSRRRGMNLTTFRIQMRALFKCVGFLPALSYVASALARRIRSKI